MVVMTTQPGCAVARVCAPSAAARVVTTVRRATGSCARSAPTGTRRLPPTQSPLYPVSSDAGRAYWRGADPPRRADPRSLSFFVTTVSGAASATEVGTRRQLVPDYLRHDGSPHRGASGRFSRPRKRPGPEWRQALCTSSIRRSARPTARRRLDNVGERKDSIYSQRNHPLRGDSQCPWNGSLESSSTSSLTMRMAGWASVFA
jgi:hypothetical protein